MEGSAGRHSQRTLDLPDGAWQAIEAAGRWSSPMGGTVVIPRKQFSVLVTTSPEQPGQYTVTVHLYLRTRHARHRDMEFTVTPARLQVLLQRLLQPSEPAV
ncbi:MAG TPA: hypothetical protein VHN99_04940 [Deinococcales bacterium]|nr:hypothetical protein [Deinococcales bacterium]